MATRMGRPPSIPVSFYARVFQLYSLGFGYRRIAEMLEDVGVYTTRGSVERLVKGRGCYAGRRVTVEQNNGLAYFFQGESPV